MAKQTKPRIFISHSWDDKPLVRRLENELRDAGAEVWVDHEGIRGGDNLPERISNALEWCNTLLLIWSETASKSRWVKLEWTNAVSLEKLIIPCQLSSVRLPAILAHKAYINFKDVDDGIKQLLNALNLARQNKPQSTAKQPAAEIARVLHDQLQESTSPSKPKPPQQAVSHLRSQPLELLSLDQVKKMLREKDFFDSFRHKDGKGIQHKYEAIEREGQKLVLDHATGLTWQQSGSESRMTFEDAEKYIKNLNKEKHGGYDDWRLPTLEEAMSLMEPEQKHGDLYIDPVFGKTQRWIWTADKLSASFAWVVNFSDGYCYYVRVDFDGYYVRAVR